MSTIRASSFPELFDCAHRWEGKHILGLSLPSGLRARLGTAIHAGTAAFDAARVEGNPITPDEAASVLVDALHHPTEDVDYSQDDLTVREAERIGLILHTKYCLEVSPRYEFLSVERTIKPLTIDCGSGVEITLTGTLDRSRTSSGRAGKGIVDLKSGGAAVESVPSPGGKRKVAKTKGHAAQIGVYELLEAHTSGAPCTAPAEIIGLKTRGKPEIATGEIHGAARMLTGDAETPGLIDYAAAMFRTGLFPPNPQSMLCSERYCPRWATCRFHP